MDSLSPPTQILLLLPLAAASEEAAAVAAPPVEAAAVTEAALLDRHAAQLARLEVATASSWCGGPGAREQGGAGTGAWPPLLLLRSHGAVSLLHSARAPLLRR